MGRRRSLNHPTVHTQGPGAGHHPVQGAGHGQQRGALFEGTSGAVHLLQPHPAPGGRWLYQGPVLLLEPQNLPITSHNVMARASSSLVLCAAGGNAEFVAYTVSSLTQPQLYG